MKAVFRRMVLPVAAIAVIFAAAACPLFAQAPTGPQNGAQPPQDQNTPKPAPAAPPPQQGGVTISVEVPVVTLDVVAATQHGDILTGLTKENFRVTQDGVPQTISNFSPTDAPITTVLLLEFSSRGMYEYFGYMSKYWATALFPALKQKDWVALETFDMRTRLEVDFTQDKREVIDAINHLYFPGFSESNLFDALVETADRLKDVKGKKSIIVVASGVDTFSKHTLDKTFNELRQTDATIFCVGLGQAYQNFQLMNGRGRGSNLTLLQAENQLKEFSRMTGGNAWFPQFDAELPGIFQQVASFLRNQYSISYTPTTGANDGKFHKIKVELVAPDGGPLTVLDQKGKKQKFVVYAREGYEAPKAGTGD